MKPKVYLDNCCYNRPYDDQTQTRIKEETQAKMSIQRAIINGGLDLVTSTILYYENSRNDCWEARETIEEFMVHNEREYISMESEAVKEIQKRVMKTGLKFYDSYHVACALCSSCDFFITVDDRILKRKFDSIEIVDPIQFLTKWR